MCTHENPCYFNTHKVQRTNSKLPNFCLNPYGMLWVSLGFASLHFGVSDWGSPFSSSCSLASLDSSVCLAQAPETWCSLTFSLAQGSGSDFLHGAAANGPTPFSASLGAHNTPAQLALFLSCFSSVSKATSPHGGFEGEEVGKEEQSR